MNNLDIYCVTNKRVQFLENSSYKLCSVGKNFSHENYQKSFIKQNIFHKEKLINFFYKSSEICFSSSIQFQSTIFFRAHVICLFTYLFV